MKTSKLMQKYFSTKAEALASASALDTVEDVSTTSYVMPPKFWGHLTASPAVFAKAVRAHADKVGALESAWDDALDGAVSGVDPQPLLALDAQFRRAVRTERWMVTTPSVPAPAAQSSGDGSGSGYGRHSTHGGLEALGDKPYNRADVDWAFDPRNSANQWND